MTPAAIRYVIPQ